MIKKQVRTYGFAMIELLIVAAFFILMSTLLMFSYFKLRQDALMRNAESAVVSMLHTARTMAISQPNTDAAEPYRDFAVAIDIDPVDGTWLWVDELIADSWEDLVVGDSVSNNDIINPKVTTPIKIPDEISLSVRAAVGQLPFRSTVREVYYIPFRPDGSSLYATFNLINRLDDAAVGTNYHSVVVYPATGICRKYPNEKK